MLVRATNRDAHDRTLRAEWTYAPNVGIVRIATAEMVAGKELPQVTLELKSYKLNKPEAAPGP